MKARDWIDVGRVALFAVFLVGLSWAAIVSWHRTLSLLPAVVFALVGLVVTRRKPQNAIGWLFLGVGAACGLIGASNAAMEVAIGEGRPTVWFSMAAAIAANFLWLVVLTLGVILPLLLFPNGLLSTRWRPVMWVAVWAMVVGVVIGAFAPEVTISGHDYANPLQLDRWDSVASKVWVAALAALSICGLLALVSTILRFRRSSGVERVQMRWFAFSGAVLIVTLFIPGLNDNDFVFGLVFSLVPLSCGVAILKYHLYDIDRIISRTTSYAIVTGLLLATYVTIVGTASHFFHNDSTLVVAAATLAAAALARPVLRSVQTIVDRRFNRSRYDAIHTVDTFGTRLRNQVDPDQVSGELVATVTGTLEPSLIRIWIRPT